MNDRAGNLLGEMTRIFDVLNKTLSKARMVDTEEFGSAGIFGTVGRLSEAYGLYRHYHELAEISIWRTGDGLHDEDDQAFILESVERCFLELSTHLDQLVTLTRATPPVEQRTRAAHAELIARVENDVAARRRSIVKRRIERQRVLLDEQSDRTSRAVQQVEEAAPPQTFNPASWTGRDTPHDIGERIRVSSATVLEGLTKLISAMEEKRFNDEEALDALAEAKNLHAALGELIRLAENTGSFDRLADRFNDFKDRALAILGSRATFFAVSPLLTMGTVVALEGLSHKGFGDGSIATIWAGWMAARLGSDAVPALQKIAAQTGKSN